MPRVGIKANPRSRATARPPPQTRRQDVCRQGLRRSIPTCEKNPRGRGGRRPVTAAHAPADRIRPGSTAAKERRYTHCFDVECSVTADSSGLGAGSSWLARRRDEGVPLRYVQERQRRQPRRGPARHEESAVTEHEPRWRNWQTRQLEVLVGFISRGGSSPLLGIGGEEGMRDSGTKGLRHSGKRRAARSDQCRLRVAIVLYYIVVYYITTEQGSACRRCTSRRRRPWRRASSRSLRSSFSLSTCQPRAAYRTHLSDELNRLPARVRPYSVPQRLA